MEKLLVIVAGMLFIVNSTLALDDPTRPPWLKPVAGDTTPGWQVSSIRIATKHKTAVINGRSVAIGDVVNGAAVVDIEPTRVMLKKAGKTFAVRLFTNNITKITRLPAK